MKKPATRGLLTRPEREERAKKTRIAIITASIVLGLVGIITCGYGHAAMSADLFISGEAIIKTSGGFESKYMQDLTPEECTNARYLATAQMIDKRDGKSYWITKMHDNQCWMTQSLALDITTAGLDSELSDINYSATAKYTETTNERGETIYHWDENSAYPPKNTVYKVSNAGTSYTNTLSWNLGEYVIKNPLSTSTCSSNSVGLANCSQFQNVGATYDDDGNLLTPAFSPDLSYAEVKATYDTEARTYDAHFLAGNYYQYMTAMAGSGAVTASTIAPSSICPKGWRLVNRPSTSASEMTDLFTKYLADVGGTIYPSINPFYINRVGKIDKGQIVSAGLVSRYFVSKSGTKNNAQGFGASSANQHTSQGFGIGSEPMYRGLNVRCILRME